MTRPPEPELKQGRRLRVAVSTLSQNMSSPSGLLSWFSQLAQFLPEADPASDYHFVLSEATREFIVGRAPKAYADLVGWDSSHQALRLLSEHVLLGRWLARERIHVLLMANAGTRPLCLPRPVRLVQGIFGFHHLGATELKPWTRLYRKALFASTLRRADRIVVNSLYSKTLLAGIDPAALAKTRVVPHGRNEQLFHAGPLTDEERAALSAFPLHKPYFAFVSQIYPYKNVHTAVAGFCRFVIRTASPHRFAIVGKFSDRWGEGELYRQRLAGIAREHELEDRLVFIDSLPVKALRALYVSAEAYIQPSLSETFGRTSLEAMACGCPVVAARAGATPEIVGEAGLYFEGEDADGLAACLARLQSDEALRRASIERGLARAERYSIRTEARQLADVFAEAAGEDA